MSDWKKFILFFLVLLIVVLPLYFGVTKTGRATWNDWFYGVQTVDNQTRYSTLKEVEDTCRAMIASYTKDKLTYEQYKDSDSAEKQSWAEQAKMRANQTAATYNEYILKNSFIWEQDVPWDIKTELDYLN